MITLALKTWGNRPENHCFRNQVTKTDAVIILKTSEKRLKYRSPKFVIKMGRYPITRNFLGKFKNMEVEFNEESGL